MQINLFHPVIKKVIPFVGWALFIICLLIKCNNEKTEIVIPEKIGSLKTQTIIKHDSIIVSLEIPKWYKDTKKEKELLDSIEAKEIRIKLYQEEFEFMQDEYKFMDSVEKANAYKIATTPKNFSSSFNDDFIELNIQGVVMGSQVKEITPFYKIKEQKIQVTKKSKLLLGFGGGSNFQLNQFVAKTNLSLQNKKDNIYTLSYQRIGQQNFGLFEYNFNLIK